VNNDTLIVNEDPLVSNSAASFFKTCVGILKSVDVSSIDDKRRMTLEYSNANATELFADGDDLIGADSGATATIDTVVNLPLSYFNANIYKTDATLTQTTVRHDGEVIQLGTTRYLQDTTFIKSRSREIAEDSGANSFEFTIDLLNKSPGNAHSTPFLDHKICNILAAEYVVNEMPSTNLSERTSTGDAFSKYISKIIQLSDGMDASDINVFLTAYRPVGTNIDVYIKFQNKSDTRSFDAIEWSKLQLRDSANFFSTDASRNDFREFEYIVPTATSAVAGEGAVKIQSGTSIEDEITYISPLNSAEFNTFKNFAVKIVFSSTTPHRVPRVRDIRAIALA
jgi:hypothetical protein